LKKKNGKPSVLGICSEAFRISTSDSVKKGMEGPKRLRASRVGISSDKCFNRESLKPSMMERRVGAEKVDSVPFRERRYVL
jgi:hypothetical protein